MVKKLRPYLPEPLANQPNKPQPPKRRGAPSSSTGPREKRTRQSKLAKENGITGDEEAEIKEAFHLFSTKSDEYPTEKEGVIKTQDVRRALMYVCDSPTQPTVLRSANTLTHKQTQSPRPPTRRSKRTNLHPLRRRPYVRRPRNLRTVSLRLRSETPLAQRRRYLR